MSDDEYADSLREAIYLEIGWSDFLFQRSSHSTTAENAAYPNPLYDLVAPSFYQEIAGLVEAWVRKCSLIPNNYCDIGGGPGRTIHEIGARFPNLNQLVLAEPSKIFCDWARRLLIPDGQPPEVPMLRTGGLPVWNPPHSWPPPIPQARNRISIVNKSVEELTEDSRFDLITCLNVVDRHPDPSSVISTISKHMNENGLLVLSSPMDFRSDTTPEQANWIDDLNTLFSRNDTWSHVGQCELLYEYRSSSRSWTRLCSQVVAKRFNSTQFATFQTDRDA